MELWCRIPGENLEVLTFLMEKNYKPQLRKDCIIVQVQNGDIIYGFPTNAEFYIKLWEYGGGMTKTGKAGIICGPYGQKLKPFLIRTKGDLSNKIHAIFYEIGASIVTCSKHGSCSIDYVQVNMIHDSVIQGERHIWKGNIKNLPNTFNQYKDALEAAHKKANHYHCRIPYYIKE